MNDPITCTRCGTRLAAENPSGLCPDCLLAVGLGSLADATAPEASIRFTPPSIQEISPLFPQLEIEALLGCGGMGAVYRARQRNLDRTVALKILPPDIGRDPAFAARFAREAKALAKLGHPNIVTLYEFGQAGDLFYFLMEYVDGVNLRQVTQSERIAPREALAIVPQICDALQYAHDQGIVHRDIKPENILLDRRGRVKVADFGVAKIVRAADPAQQADIAAASGDGASHAGLVMGTPSYMAPEQREHPSEVDHRADIYSLGVVLYQMLTGELPASSVVPPSKKIALDVRVDEIVLRALEKTPERRYQQVSDIKTMCAALAVPTAADDKSRPARGFALVERRGERAAIRWADATAAFVGLLALSALAFSAFTMATRGTFDALGTAVTGTVFATTFLWVRILERKKALLAQPPPECEARVSAARRWGEIPWIPYAVFLVLYLSSIGLLASSAEHLPQRVATHFGFSGQADGWMAREAYFAFFCVFLMAVAALLASISLFVRSLPARYVNIPRKDYWLAPERRALTSRILLARMGWLLCLITLFFAGLHVLTVQANRVSPPQLPMGGLLMLIIAFLLGVMIWVSLLLMRFAEADAPAQRDGPTVIERQRARWGMGVLLTITTVIALRMWVVDVYTVHSEAVSPEIPQGSLVLVWKPAPALTAGDLLVYRSSGRFWVGRVSDVQGDAVRVNRNRELDTPIPKQTIRGRVISVLWRGTQEKKATP